MNPGVFIKGSGVISPQMSFDGRIMDEGFVTPTGNRLQCVEPDYTLFIDPKQIRRMSRIIKMSVVSSIIALKQAGIEKPDAVIVGTAFGCLDDTYAFLSKLVQFKEDMLSPTAFIHSTHNTIAAQIALHNKCYGYNSTYVHRSVSFESALTDAIMLLNAGEVSNVLVGGADEIIDAGFTIMDRLGHFKNEEEVQGNNFYDTMTKGSVAGEGAAFFTLVNQHSPDCKAKVKAVETWSFVSSEQVAENIRLLLEQEGIASVSVILSGYNGDESEDNTTSSVIENITFESGTENFKHLCGEYGTSTAFATWLAATMLKEQCIPASGGFEKSIPMPLRNILIYNQVNNIHHSVILLEAC